MLFTFVSELVSCFNCPHDWQSMTSVTLEQRSEVKDCSEETVTIWNKANFLSRKNAIGNHRKPLSCRRGKGTNCATSRTTVRQGFRNLTARLSVPPGERGKWKAIWHFPPSRPRTIDFIPPSVPHNCRVSFYETTEIFHSFADHSQSCLRLHLLLGGTAGQRLWNWFIPSRDGRVMAVWLEPFHFFWPWTFFCFFEWHSSAVIVKVIHPMKWWPCDWNLSTCSCLGNVLSSSVLDPVAAKEALWSPAKSNLAPCMAQPVYVCANVQPKWPVNIGSSVSIVFVDWSSVVLIFGKQRDTS